MNEIASVKDQFKSIRIPSVVVTKKGTVLAIAEGRAQHADQANNKLILKRSTDAGKTWGEQQIIAHDGENCLNNPCTVVDQKSGHVIVMYQSYPAGFSERDGNIKPGLDGPAIVRNYVVTSDDDGVTWSKPADVTRTTKTYERVTIGADVNLGAGCKIMDTDFHSLDLRERIGELGIALDGPGEEVLAIFLFQDRSQFVEFPVALQCCTDGMSWMVR
jgi:Neuraminidase (sialidase)